MLQIRNDFLFELFDLFQKEGFISSNTVRNYKIQCSYDEALRKGENSKQARERLAESYYLSTKAIEQIIYTPERRRKKPEAVLSNKKK